MGRHRHLPAGGPARDRRGAHLPRGHARGLLLRPRLEPWNITSRLGVGHLGGGIAIYGALIGGAIGAILGCKWTGIRFWTFADALAPASSSPAMGRFGNWFNQELFGQPTDLPWGLEIAAGNPPFRSAARRHALPPHLRVRGHLEPPGCRCHLYVGKRFTLQWGKQFAIYLVWYSAGSHRVGVDPRRPERHHPGAAHERVGRHLRRDPRHRDLHRAESRRHHGYEPSRTCPGRESKASGAVDSGDPSDFVDVSEPPATSDTVGTSATSSPATN